MFLDKVLVVALTAVLTLSAFSVMSSAQSPPGYSVIGFVRNELDIFIPEATVIMTNNITGESLSTTTDFWGRYIFDLGELTEGYGFGDEISLFASKNSLGGYGSGTVTEGVQNLFINVTIGDISRPDIQHTPLSSAPVDRALAINAVISDDIEVHTVILFYMFPGSSSFENMTMTLTSGNTSTGVWSGFLSEPEAVGTLFYYFSANDTAKNTNISDIYSINILHGKAMSLKLDTVTEIVAGYYFGVTCRAVDLYGNTVLNYSGTVNLSSTDSHPVASSSFYSHQFHIQDKGEYEFKNVTLCTALVHTIIAKDLSESSIESNVSIIVNPASVSHVKILPDNSTIIAGTYSVFSVRLMDEYENLAYTDKPIEVYLQTTSVTGSFQPSNTLLFETGRNSLTILYMDTDIYDSPYTLTANNQSLISEDALVYIVSSDVDRWVIEADANMVAGLNLTLAIGLEDKFGNPLSMANDTTVEFFTSSWTGAFLVDGAEVNMIGIPAGSTKAWLNYSDWSTANSPVMLRVSNGTSIPDGMTIINITHASPHHIFVIAPSIVRAGEPINVSGIILDKFGNMVTNYTGNVRLIMGETMLINTLSESDEGEILFESVVLTETGVWDIVMECYVGEWIGGSRKVEVIAGNAVRFNVSGPSLVEAGSPFSIVLTPLDSWNNVATDYLGTVKAKSTDPISAILPIPYTFTEADSGGHLFSGIVVYTVPSQTLTFYNVDNSSINGSLELFIFDITPPTMIFDQIEGVWVGKNFWRISVTTLDDVRIETTCIFYSFDNQSFNQLNMSQISGNLSIGQGNYSVDIPSEGNSHLHFYLGAFDGQNWFFLNSTNNGPFYIEHSWGWDLPIYFTIGVIFFALAAFVYICFHLKRKRKR